MIGAILPASGDVHDRRSDAEARPRARLLAVPGARRRQHDRLGHLPAAGAARAPRLERVLRLAAHHRRRALPGLRVRAARARLAGRAPAPSPMSSAAFGRLPAFVVTWSYWISIWVGNAALAVAGGQLSLAVRAGAGQPPGARRAGRRSACVWALTAGQLPGRARRRRGPGGHRARSSWCRWSW